MVVDSCHSDIGGLPPKDTIYVASAPIDGETHGDLTKGVIHPTLSRYSVSDIVNNGSYETWN